MEMWPPEFEDILRATPLPSADLDLNLAEYAKVLCSILGIPTYDNPIESLHLMFSLYADFKSNPHFQAQNTAHFDQHTGGYGDADVMHINQGFK
jgi:intraflagellar transport protein 46